MAPLLAKLYRRLGVRYFWVYVAFEALSTLVICLGTVALFSLYTEMDSGEFLKVLAFAEACAVVAIGFVMFKGVSGRVPLYALPSAVDERLTPELPPLVADA